MCAFTYVGVSRRTELSCEDRFILRSGRYRYNSWELGQAGEPHAVTKLGKTPVEADVSVLLRAWSGGDQNALDKLAPIVYDELRRLARYYLHLERPGHSLQATALVNEAYLRLVDYKRMRWENRAHFLSGSAQLMRRILVARTAPQPEARWRHPARCSGRRSGPRRRSR